MITFPPALTPDKKRPPDKECRPDKKFPPGKD
jgi:hypothetical protein